MEIKQTTKDLDLEVQAIHDWVDESDEEDFDVLVEELEKKFSPAAVEFFTESMLSIASINA